MRHQAVLRKMSKGVEVLDGPGRAPPYAGLRGASPFNSAPRPRGLLTSVLTASEAIPHYYDYAGVKEWIWEA